MNKEIIEGNVEFIFRNNSTGNPTLKHIINPDTDISYCGFKDDFYAQIHDNEFTTTYKYEVCKKCLKAHENKIK